MSNFGRKPKRGAAKGDSYEGSVPGQKHGASGTRDREVWGRYPERRGRYNPPSHILHPISVGLGPDKQWVWPDETADSGRFVENRLPSEGDRQDGPDEPDRSQYTDETMRVPGAADQQADDASTSEAHDRFTPERPDRYKVEPHVTEDRHGLSAMSTPLHGTKVSETPVDNLWGAPETALLSSTAESAQFDKQAYELAEGLVTNLCPGFQTGERQFYDCLIEVIDRYEAFAARRGPQPVKGPYPAKTILPPLLRVLELLNAEPIAYQIVRTTEELHSMLAVLRDHEIIGLDLETDSLDEHTGHIATCQFSTVSDNFIVMWPPADEDAFVEFLGGEGHTFVAHHAVFERRFLKKAFPTLRIRNMFDTMGGQYVLLCGAHKGRLSLAETALMHLRRNVTKDAEVRLSFRGDMEISTEQAEYAALDAQLCQQLYPVMRRKLEAEGLWDAAMIEAVCTESIAGAWHVGVGTFCSQLSEVESRIRDEIGTLVPLIQANLRLPPDSVTLFPLDVDLDSPDQLLKRFRDLGVPLPGTTDKYVLEQFDHPAAHQIIEYRALAKHLSSVILPLQRATHPTTGRVHTNWKQYWTDTGRFSNEDPALMNLPVHSEIGELLRGCFVPREDHSFVICDFSQIQLRIAAEIAKDPVMIETFRLGQDIHSMTASRVLGIPYAEFVRRVAAGDKAAKDWRFRAKAINFGFLFGMQAKTFRLYAKHNYQVDFTLEEAEEIRAAFFNTYRGLAKWHRQTQLDVNRLGARYTARTLSGRRRLFSQGSVTQALNTPVQGTEADMAKLAMAYLCDYDWMQLVLMVHDEFVMEVPDDLAAEGLEITKREMQAAGEVFLKSVPVVVDGHTAKKWQKDA